MAQCNICSTIFNTCLCYLWQIATGLYEYTRYLLSGWIIQAPPPYGSLFQLWDCLLPTGSWPDLNVALNVWILQIFGFVEISVSHLPWHQYIFVYHFLVNHKHVIQSIFCSLNIHRNHFGKLQVFSLVVCMQYYNHTLMSLSICFGK